MKANVYLNFPGETEAAFQYYQSIFGTKLTDIVRFGDMPAGGAKMSDADKKKVMHVGLPLGDGILMGSDTLESLGHKTVKGNNFYVSLHVDSRGEADRLFAALADGGKVEMKLTDMPWGDYWGALADRFGVQWMVSHTPKPAP